MNNRPLMKLYNQDMQIYSDPKAERWLMDMAVKLKRQYVMVNRSIPIISYI